MEEQWIRLTRFFRVKPERSSEERRPSVLYGHVGWESGATPRPESGPLCLETQSAVLAELLACHRRR